MVRTYAQLYMDTRKALMEKEEVQYAGMLARQLLCHLSGKSQEQFLADRDLYASDVLCRQAAEATDRLLRDEPLAYVLGEWEFYGLTLYVDKHVLIPRDDTCAVAELAIKMAQEMGDPRVLDLCTGSGCIGLAVASRVKDARVTLADISKDALSLAKKNVMRHSLSGRVSCIKADARETPSPFMGKFDIIVSNPPYITGREMLELPASVSNYEPHLALFGGADGLNFYRSIAKNFAAALKPSGFLCFEFGMGQGDDVCRILEDNQYTVLERTRDYNGVERAVLAQLSGKEE